MHSVAFLRLPIYHDKFAFLLFSSVVGNWFVLSVILDLVTFIGPD
jgi:hypothetical protein